MAKTKKPPITPDPNTRRLVIDVCDRGHQAIAFAGTCPFCHPPGLREGHLIYAADLRRMLEKS